jgi:hypothetical protein
MENNMKFHFLTIIILSTLSMNCFSQGYSSPANSGEEGINGAPDFGKSKGEMISFHMMKVVDHQKVVDCLKKSVDFESMNACNVHLEKYIKKKEVKEEEEKK